MIFFSILLIFTFKNIDITSMQICDVIMLWRYQKTNVAVNLLIQLADWNFPNETCFEI